MTRSDSEIRADLLQDRDRLQQLLHDDQHLINANALQMAEMGRRVVAAEAKVAQLEVQLEAANDSYSGLTAEQWMRRGDLHQHERDEARLDAQLTAQEAGEEILAAHYERDAALAKVAAVQRLCDEARAAMKLMVARAEDRARTIPSPYADNIVNAVRNEYTKYKSRLADPTQPEPQRPCDDPDACPSWADCGCPALQQPTPDLAYCYAENLHEAHVWNLPASGPYYCPGIEVEPGCPAAGPVGGGTKHE